MTRVGEVFEIGGYRARVVGFTRGIRSFTTSPYVFTTFKNAQDYTATREDQTMFVLVKVAPGADHRAGAARNLLDRVKDVEVFTTAQFSRMTHFYWMFTTGAGVAVLIAAVLGLVVGFVVVAQTIYATTMDHMKRIRNAESDGRAQQLCLQGHHHAGGDQRSDGLCAGNDRQRVRGACQPEGRRGDSDALADGGGNVFSDPADVRGRGAGVDQQSHAASIRRWCSRGEDLVSFPTNEAGNRFVVRGEKRFFVSRSSEMQDERGVKMQSAIAVRELTKTYAEGASGTLALRGLISMCTPANCSC